jgi:hypothetical protein
MRRSGDYVDSGEGWARPAGRGKAFVWLIRRQGHAAETLREGALAHVAAAHATRTSRSSRGAVDLAGADVATRGGRDSGRALQDTGAVAAARVQETHEPVALAVRVIKAARTALAVETNGRGPGRALAWQRLARFAVAALAIVVRDTGGAGILLGYRPSFGGARLVTTTGAQQRKHRDSDRETPLYRSGFGHGIGLPCWGAGMSAFRVAPQFRHRASRRRTRIRPPGDSASAQPSRARRSRGAMLCPHA